MLKKKSYGCWGLYQATTFGVIETHSFDGFKSNERCCSAGKIWLHLVYLKLTLFPMIIPSQRHIPLFAQNFLLKDVFIFCCLVRIHNVMIRASESVEWFIWLKQTFSFASLPGSFKLSVNLMPWLLHLFSLSLCPLASKSFSNCLTESRLPSYE